MKLWWFWFVPFKRSSFNLLKPAELRPVRTRWIFVYFAEIFVISSVLEVRTVFFFLPKFCQALPNFKSTVVLPRSRTNFCQAWNLTVLSIYTPWFEGKCQSRKFDLYFWSEYFSPKPTKIKFIFARQSTINMEDSYLGMLHDDPFAQYNYYGYQVYVNVPAASPGPSSAQFVHPYVHPSQPSTSTSANFTTTLIKLKARKRWC